MGLGRKKAQQSLGLSGFGLKKPAPAWPTWGGEDPQPNLATWPSGEANKRLEVILING